MPIIKTINTVSVPPQPENSYEETSYQCSDCSQAFDVENDANKHFGKRHTVQASLTFGFPAKRAYLVLTAENFKLWLNSYRVDGGARIGGWKSPGWYVLNRTSERCGRGCCYKDWVSADSIENVVGSCLYRIQQEKATILEAEKIQALGLDYRSDVPDDTDD